MSTSMSLAGVASLQLAAQLAFQLLVLAQLGLGGDSDAFVAAQAVPAVLTSVLAVSLQNAWQTRLALAQPGGGAWQTAHREAHAQALMATALAGCFLGATAVLWVPLLFAGLQPGGERLVLQLTPALLLACVFQGASAVLTTAQRGRNRPVSAEMAALAGTLASLAAVVPAMKLGGVHAAVHVLLARSVLVWLALQCLVGWAWPRWMAGWQDRDAWKQLRTLLGGASLYKTSPLIDRYWGAMAPAGGLTLFSLAQTGMAALTAVFERSLCVPVVPRLSRLVAAGDAGAARALCRGAVARVALASLAVALGFLLTRPWWGPALHAVLALPEARVAELWLMCGLLLGYMFVGAAGTVVVAVFYALGDTATPVRIGVIGFFVGVVVKSAGFLLGGIIGLALATSLHYLINLVALWVVVERRLDTLAVAAPPLR